MIDQLKRQLLLYAAAVFCALVAATLLTHAAHHALSLIYGAGIASLLIALVFAALATGAVVSAGRKKGRATPDPRVPEAEVGAGQLASAFMTGLKIANPDYRQR